VEVLEEVEEDTVKLEEVVVGGTFNGLVLLMILKIEVHQVVVVVQPRLCLHRLVYNMQ
jgi:hypothetical protein